MKPLLIMSQGGNSLSAGAFFASELAEKKEDTTKEGIKYDHDWYGPW